MAEQLQIRPGRVFDPSSNVGPILLNGKCATNLHVVAKCLLDPHAHDRGVEVRVQAAGGGGVGGRRVQGEVAGLLPIDVEGLVEEYMFQGRVARSRHAW